MRYLDWFAVRAASLAIAIVLVACGDRSSSVTTTTHPPVADSGAVAVDTAPPLDTTPAEPYPNDWIEAPAGLCTNIDNLAETTYVLDGDTVALTTGKKVRYLGVDAPEVTKNDCWAQQAKQALSDLPPMQTTVCLQTDGDSEDAFGRLLRYVYVKHGEKWVMENARVVRIGAARAYHKYLPGKAYASQIEAAEAEAKQDDIGGWAGCPNWDVKK